MFLWARMRFFCVVQLRAFLDISCADKAQCHGNRFFLCRVTSSIRSCRLISCRHRDMVQSLNGHWRRLPRQRLDLGLDLGGWVQLLDKVMTCFKALASECDEEAICVVTLRESYLGKLEAFNGVPSPYAGFMVSSVLLFSFLDLVWIGILGSVPNWQVHSCESGWHRQAGLVGSGNKESVSYYTLN
ncbi:hypothetical protein BGZ63DRAFT_5421 [Mariannaea sp. PMI_226]|nr:hypothetical protein BGZ63DRAFT_5421 [Mariannaea sp. PMI_226]